VPRIPTHEDRVQALCARCIALLDEAGRARGRRRLRLYRDAQIALQLAERLERPRGHG
jgi:hypothetical protein